MYQDNNLYNTELYGSSLEYLYSLPVNKNDLSYYIEDAEQHLQDYGFYPVINLESLQAGLKILLTHLNNYDFNKFKSLTILQKQYENYFIENAGVAFNNVNIKSLLDEISLKKDLLTEEQKDVLLQLYTGDHNKNFCWINPNRILSNRLSTLTTNNSDHNYYLFFDRNGRELPAPTKDPNIANTEFGHRILESKNKLKLLDELFNSPLSRYAAGINVVGQNNTEYGPVFIIHYNGNHRVQAFKSIEAPCVLAEVFPSEDRAMNIDFFNSPYIKYLMSIGYMHKVEPERRLEFNPITLNSPGNTFRIHTNNSSLINPNHKINMGFIELIEDITGMRISEPVPGIPREIFFDQEKLKQFLKEYQTNETKPSIKQNDNSRNKLTSFLLVSCIFVFILIICYRYKQ